MYGLFYVVCFTYGRGSARTRTYLSKEKSITQIRAGMNPRPLHTNPDPGRAKLCRSEAEARALAAEFGWATLPPSVEVLCLTRADLEVLKRKYEESQRERVE